jgi:hypothetical protein
MGLCDQSVCRGAELDTPSGLLPLALRAACSGWPLAVVGSHGTATLRLGLGVYLKSDLPACGQRSAATYLWP